LNANDCAQISGAMEILRKFARTTSEHDPLQRTIQHSLGRMQRNLDLALGRSYLAKGEYRKATEAYQRANEYRKQVGLTFFGLLLRALQEARGALVGSGSTWPGKVAALTF